MSVSEVGSKVSELGTSAKEGLSSVGNLVKDAGMNIGEAVGLVKPEPWYYFYLKITAAIILLAFIGIALSILNFKKYNLNIKPLNKLISNKYYLDYIYETLITEKLFYKYFSNLFSYIEKNIVDNFSYKLTSSLKWMANKISISQNGQLQLQSITFIGGGIWMLIAMVIAVRQALDYESTWRAIGVVVIGFLVQAIVLILLMRIFGPS